MHALVLMDLKGKMGLPFGGVEKEVGLGVVGGGQIRSKTCCIKILTNIIERRDSGLWPHLIRVQDTIMTNSSLSKESLTTEIVAMIV